MSRTNGVRAYRYGGGEVQVFGSHPGGRRRLRVALVNFGDDTTGEQLATLRAELVIRCDGAHTVDLVCVDTDYQVSQLITGILERECESVAVVWIDGG